MGNKEIATVFISFVICLSIGVTLFLVNIWGGGDSKLLISLSPLFSPSGLMDFFFGILFCGGILSVVYLIKYRFILKMPLERGLPYGVAIVFGAILSIYLSPQGFGVFS